MNDARFWDKIADRYAAQPVSDPAAYEHKLQKTREYFRPDSRVLEFACGTGTTTLSHAPYVRSLLACDISARMLAYARDKAEKAAVTNVEFVQGELLELDLEDSSFDVVMGHSILHLLPERASTLERVHRLLRPGGVFVSSTVCLGEMGPHMRVILPLLRLVGKAPLVRIFRVADLERELSAAGFAVEYRMVPKSSKAVCFLVARRP
jgi:ubiquinone/menaquinone biosynthesis C-methylase UbiE